MIRFFHEHRKTVLGIFGVAVAALSMSGFGVNMFNSYQQDQIFAIKVGDEILTHTDFDRKRTQLQDRYQAMFGKNYAQFAKMIEANLNQQVVDSMIAETLMNQEADKLNFFASPEEITTVIKRDVFGGRLDSATFKGYLAHVGMTAEAFEESIGTDAKRNSITDILSAVSFAGSEEARSLWELEQTKYDAEYVAFEPTALKAEVPAADEKSLEAYYTDHASEYEKPAAVQYNYLAIDPAKFLHLVEVIPDDVELYYSDHQSDFMGAPTIKARHIQLTFPKQADPKQMAAMKEKAQRALARIKEGADFATVATDFSDDVTTSLQGGDLGWISQGKMSPEFDAAAFKLAAGATSELIETPYGFHIVKVEEVKAGEPKKLDDVRAQIETLIKEREAPAYAAEHAQKLLKEWKASGKTLTDFASSVSLKTESSERALTEQEDPTFQLKGLTENVLSFAASESKSLAELEKLSVLVEVSTYREVSIPPFAEVREKVVADYTTMQAKKLVTTKANDLVAALKNGSVKDLSAACAAQKLTCEKVAGISRSGGGTGPFMQTDIRQAVFGAKAAGEQPQKSYPWGEKAVVYQVTAITKPDPKTATEAIADTQKRTTQDNTRVLMTSLINKLKAESTIDVDPSLLREARG